MSIKALSDYTYYSRYARYNKDKKRRETWEEAVKRVFDMHREKYKEQIVENPELGQLIDFSQSMQVKKRVLAAQRSLQFAGSPIFKHELKMFNCLTTHIDRSRVFQETMYALLCGCGVGFSVQKQHVNNLPKLNPPTGWRKYKTYVVEDSIEGWADAVGVIINSYLETPLEFSEYNGHAIQFDVSKIRPEGELIAGQFKAPGPKGLLLALDKLNNVISNRISSEGFNSDDFKSKLRPIDCYDIIMHISDAVLSGGVRRSATLALFSHDDDEMITAKTGNWMEHNPQRGRSNNSAALLKGAVTREEFHELIESTKQFGEPGFIWVDDLDIVYNPCCLSRESLITTDKGPRKVSDLLGKRFTAIIDGKSFESSNDGFFKSGEKELYLLSTKEGYNLELTKDHKVLTEKNGWVEAQNLSLNDSIIIHNHKDNQWDGFGNRNEGWLVGSLLGDGTFDKTSALLDYWGKESEYMPEMAVSMIYEEGLNTYQNITGGFQQSTKISKIKKKRIGSVKLKQLAEKVGITPSKDIGDQIYYTSSDFIKGFLSGWFDADGSVQGDQKKGVSIRLSSCKLQNLKIAQKLLNCLGIFSKIYKERSPEGFRSLPNGKDGYSDYWCNANHELIIANEEIVKFSDIIGFYNKEKSLKLIELMSSYKRSLNKTKHTAKFQSLEFIKTEEVFDCTIPDIHAFDANGIYVHNCEIGMIPKTVDGESGWQSCNLTEINGKWCDTKENFLKACEASAIIGTLQAGYTNLKYLGETSKQIFEHEALLGCSITGMMDNPDIIFNEDIQKEGAKFILETNEKVAKMLGINPTARATCVKPAGSTSCILGTSSGIHPHHAKKYIRRVQANKSEFCLHATAQINPTAVEESVWSSNKTDKVISFLCEVPVGAIVKNQLKAIDLLEKVKLTQQNWVEFGTRPERGIKSIIRHNVSNTITVKSEEWDEVENFIFDNQKYFAGISLLASSGDLDYPQAPFATVLTPQELVKEYGDASVFASGLIVDGLHAFEDNLWNACSFVLGYTETDQIMTRPEYPTKKSNKELAEYFLSKESYDTWFNKEDWVRRMKQFSERYFNGDIKRTTYCLKHVSLWKTWCDLKRDYVEIDWTQLVENMETYVSADTLGAAACSGGSCEINF